MSSTVLPEPPPVVRVRDAALHAVDGPVRVTVSRLSAPERVADRLASAGGRSTVAHGRLTAVTTPSRLVDATGRALGREPAEALEDALAAALDAWSAPSPDLEARGAVLPTAERTVVMGVLNVTPDSFSDGGQWYDPDKHPGLAVEHGRALAAAGADIVDVGGESTRPGAEPVDLDEELNRAIPVVEGLASDGIAVSIDTRKAAVAEAAVEAGAILVNDVSGGGADPDMFGVVARSGAGYVAMHMRGDPQSMQDDPRYADVVAEVFDHLAEALEHAVAAGIDPQRIAIDPGIGFAKTAAHNLSLLRRTRELTSLGRPVLVGVSRKSFIGSVSGVKEPEERLEGSLAAAAVAVALGASMVRAHDVDETLRAVRIARAIGTAPVADVD
ncbi:MAG: dihydropteroate synthase [Nitriliruptorales bacterium]